MSGFSTKLLHTHYEPLIQTGDIIPPIHISTTFKFGNEGANDYSRTTNPTRVLLEKTLAALDEVEYGLAFSSGSAVLATIVSMIEPGKRIVFSSDAYGGTYRYIVNVGQENGVAYHRFRVTVDKGKGREVSVATVKETGEIIFQ